MISARPYQKPAPDQTLAVAAPAGAFAPEAFSRGLAALGELLPEAKVRVDPAVHRRQGYFAGSDQERAAHLGALMSDPAVGVVLCARGGFGSSRLLSLLDLDALAGGGKLLAGCSDITCLLLALAGRGLVTLHAPVVTQLPRLDPASAQALVRVLGGGPAWPQELIGSALSHGRAAGPLLGGNLTMLCHLMGTPYFPDLEGSILLMEDHGETGYRLDRLLTQLELAGVWRRVAGVAVGQLSYGGAASDELRRVAAGRLESLGLPVLMDLPVGHGRGNHPLPIGARAELDTAAGLLTVGVDLA